MSKREYKYNVHFQKLNNDGTAWHPAKRSYQATTDHQAYKAWQADHDQSKHRFTELTKTVMVGEVITNVVPVRV